MKGVIIFAVVIAALAVGVALLATYWYIVLGVGAAGYAGYFFYKKNKDAGNRV